MLKHSGTAPATGKDFKTAVQWQHQSLAELNAKWMFPSYYEEFSTLTVCRNCQSTSNVKHHADNSHVLNETALHCMFAVSLPTFNKFSLPWHVNKSCFNQISVFSALYCWARTWAWSIPKHLGEDVGRIIPLQVWNLRTMLSTITVYVQVHINCIGVFKWTWYM